MQTTYRLNSEELNSDIIKSIQDMYQGKEIELVVTTVEDETEYLLKNSENRDHLLKAVKDLNKGTNTVEVTVS